MYKPNADVGKDWQKWNEVIFSKNNENVSEKWPKNLEMLQNEFFTAYF